MNWTIILLGTLVVLLAYVSASDAKICYSVGYVKRSRLTCTRHWWRRICRTTYYSQRVSTQVCCSGYIGSPPSCIAACREGEMCMDFGLKGSVQGSIDGVSVLHDFSNPTSQDCSRRAVFKVTFNQFNQSSSNELCHTCRYGHRQMLKVDVFLHHNQRHDWLLNIGDSIGNNGFGGDAGQSDMAHELQILNNNITSFASSFEDYKSNDCKAQKMWTDRFVDANVNQVTFYIANNYFHVMNNAGQQYTLCHKCLFGLDGRFDYRAGQTAADTNIYIGVNRVIRSSHRNGYGICSMKLSWEKAACREGEMCMDFGLEGSVQGSIDGVSVLHDFSNPTSHDCSRRAVFKVTFNQFNQSSSNELCYTGIYGHRQMLKVDVFLHHNQRNGWLLNIGDSIGNNGFGGDAGQSDMAHELQILNNYITSYASTFEDYKSNDCKAQRMWTDRFVNANVNQVTFYIANNYFRVMNDAGQQYTLCHKCLFGLDGRFDVRAGGTAADTNIYIGVNRVISSSYRNGYGTCFMKLSWV